MTDSEQQKYLLRRVAEETERRFGLQNRYRRLMVVSTCIGFCLGILFMAFISFAKGAL